MASIDKRNNYLCPFSIVYLSEYFDPLPNTFSPSILNNSSSHIQNLIAIKICLKSIIFCYQFVHCLIICSPIVPSGQCADEYELFEINNVSFCMLIVNIILLLFMFFLY
eukprot:553207_1